MKKFLLIALSVAFILSFNGCKKDEDNKAKTKTDFLTQKPWTVLKYEEKVGTSAWVDEFPSFAPCDRDDQYVFRRNSTYEINEGPTKCNPSDPQIYVTGSWSFKSNETILNLDGDEDYNIDQLNETTLVLSASESFGGVVYQIRLTFGN